jgi:ADP-heptose:LPS heptosyltransferase
MTMLHSENILIIKHGALGDIIQSLGPIKDIRDHYPHHSISVLTDKSYVQFFQRCPYIDAVIPDERAPFWDINKQIKLKKMIQAQSFIKVFDLQNSGRTKLYRKVWFRNQHWIGRLDDQRSESGLAGLYHLLSRSGIASNRLQAADLSWIVDDISHLLAKHHLEKNNYFVLIPGSSAKHTEKRWPHYANLTQRLIEAGQQVVIVAGPDETDIEQTMPQGTILKNLSWFELAGILSNAKFVVGNDTGPCHIASHLGRPGLAIFGPTTSAARSEISRQNFKTLEVKNLIALSAETVMQHIVTALEFSI